MLRDLDTKRYIKTRGIVVNSKKYNETSLIVEILTEKLGKLNIFVKGARMIKSDLLSISKLMAEADYILERSTRNYYINSGSLENSNLELARDPNNYLVAQYVMEMIDRTMIDRPNMKVFQLTKVFLKELRSSILDPRLLKIGFSLKYLSFIGFRPNLEECSICGQKDLDHIFFSQEYGGLVCKDCLEIGMKYVNLKEEDLNLVKRLLYLKFEEYKGIEVDKERLNRLDDMIYFFLLYTSEINELRSQNIYKKLLKI